MAKPIVSVIQAGTERAVTALSLVTVLCFLWPLSFLLKLRRTAAH